MTQVLSRRGDRRTDGRVTGDRFLWLRVAEFWFVLARKWWISLVTVSFLQPVLYLLGLGFGLGVLVDSGGNSPGGVPYAAYVASGVLAGSAMQSAFGEAAWPVLGAVKWQRQYHAQLATPPKVRDVLTGHLVFMAVRLLVTVLAFWLVMVLFGLVQWPTAPLAVLAATLTGLAFAVPITAFSVSVDSDRAFALLLRFVIIPTFLFAGVFFPVSGLPGWVQPVVWATPLWHGVEMSRAASLGTGMAPVVLLGHVAYLLAFVVGGYLVALRTFTRRLS